MTRSALNRRFVLCERPSDNPVAANFRIETAPIPRPRDGEMLLKTLWLSIDPYMRGRMSEAASYAPAIALGDVMVGETVSEVVQSNIAGFAPGDFVLGRSGWQEFALSDGAGVQRLEVEPSRATLALGPLGQTGRTAYFGLLEIGRPRTGETLVVSAAAGAVGSLVGQIGKLKGCNVIGIAGGADKCAYLREVLGFDGAVDRHDPAWEVRLRELCPNGIDIYFDNTGGPIFQAVLPLLNNHARVPICGSVASTGDEAGVDRSAQLLRTVLVKRLSVQGFIVGDFKAREAEFSKDMRSWIKKGLVSFREDVVEGLTSAPSALEGLFQGRNFGKMLVRVAPPKMENIKRAD